MSARGQASWNERHRSKTPGEPEPFLVENLSLIPHGLALDIAAGRGRNSFALARHGTTVVAVDYSEEAIEALAASARRERLAVFPVVADFGKFPIGETRFDAIVNINFLDRHLFPIFTRALRPGGVLLVDTFLIDQAEIGHPRNPDYLLRHYELRDLLAELELVRYREALVVYPDDSRAWRASALARRRA